MDSRYNNNRRGAITSEDASGQEHSTIFSVPEGPSQAKMPNNPPPPIRVGSDLLLAAMHHLKRDDLDTLPQVGRSFRRLLSTIHAIYSELEKQGKEGKMALPQRRLLDNLTISQWADSFCRLYPSAEVEEKYYSRVFSKFEFHTLNGVWDGYALSEEDLTFLLSHSVNLRAECTYIQVLDNDDGGGGGCESASLFTAKVKPTFASLWEGCKLEIYYQGKDPFNNSTLPGIGGCSSLEVEGDGLLFDYPLPALWRCPSIYIRGCWSGVDFEQIADYLVVHSTPEVTAEDPGRMLDLRLQVPQGKEDDYEPIRLKQLLEQRLQCAAYPSSISAFSLKLQLVYPAEAETEKMVMMRDFKLVAGFRNNLRELLSVSGQANGKNGAASGRNCVNFSVFDHYNANDQMIYSVDVEFG